MLEEIKSYRTITLFIIYSSFLIGITLLLQSFLLTDSVIYDSYAEQLSYDRIKEVISEQNKWKWLSYSIIPIIQSFKFFIVACCLLTGSMFFDIKLRFSDAFKAAILADTIFIIPLLIKTVWFLLIKDEYTLQDLQTFCPLSTMNIVDAKSLDPLWIYPLQTFSFFELLYILSLGFWLHQFGAKTYQKGLKIVLGSYAPGLLIWIVLVMFVTVNLNGGI